MRALGFCLAFGTAAITSLPLQASTVQFLIDESYPHVGTSGCSALLAFSFTQVGLEDLLTVNIANTSPAAVQVKLTGVGFEVPPLPGMSVGFAPPSPSGYFIALDQNVSVTPGSLNAPGGYDIMLTSDHNFGGGNSQGAPAPGESQNVTLTLGNLNTTPDQLVSLFTQYYRASTGNVVIARFQGSGAGDKVTGGLVPEPAMLALAGLALLFVRRRGLARSCHTQFASPSASTSLRAS